MVFEQTFYNFMVYMYALSLLFFSADLFGRKNPLAKQVGTGLLTFVWVLQSLFFIFRVSATTYIPVYSMFETLFFLAWILGTLSLILLLVFRMDWIFFFVSVSAFCFLLSSLFFNPAAAIESTAEWHQEEPFIFIHILFALSGYSIFALGAIFSGTYLFLHRKLKQKKWSALLNKLPSLDRIDAYAFRSVVAGAGLLVLSLLFALIWIIIIGDLSMLMDVKVGSTIGLLIMYVVYVLLHYRRGTSGKRRAWLNVCCSGVLLLNLFVVNYVSSLH
ncbi:cytochrome c biogenesis protein CcsA [Marinicrinis sediminis]|uniref:Cytochrome c biogenesis protein CcsA n=1 Tax=Marinicrinis sediminis TaxID=1652465 RepID=A0ABW5R639_9BACL